MDKKQAQKILRELNSRAQRKTRLDPQKALFEKQRAFVEDSSKLVGAYCSRRAGKSHGIAFKFTKAAVKHPGSLVPYITLTREDAKNIIWPAFQTIDIQYKIGLKFRENNGDIVFPSGSKVILRGASTKREIEKLRGSKYPVAAIDEAQGFPEDILFPLIDEVLEPAVLDYNGQILVTGTPNAACAGPFYKIVSDKTMGWAVHHWTLLDNPFLPHAAAWLEDLKKRRNWTENTPAYVREYRGMWVRDAEGLVFSFKDALNMSQGWDFVKDSATDWSYFLGIDLGFNDPTAFVVLASSEYLEKAFVVESYKESGLIPSAAAAHVERLCQKYEFTSIVADTGGFGKGYAEEMKSKFGLPIKAAQKRDKNTYIDLMNGDFTSGVLQICGLGNSELLHELRLLQWDLSSLEKNKPKIDDRRFDDHLCDALLYCWRESRHRGGELQLEGPVVGSTEYWEAEADRVFQEEVEAWEKSQNPQEDFGPNPEEIFE